MSDNAIGGENGENGKSLPMDKKPVLNTVFPCKGPAFASSRCATIASSLINEHEHIRVGDKVCNAVHICSSECIVAFQGSCRHSLSGKGKALEGMGKSGN